MKKSNPKTFVGFHSLDLRKEYQTLNWCELDYIEHINDLLEISKIQSQKIKKYEQYLRMPLSELLPRTA